jgi:hypothetical protein
MSIKSALRDIMENNLDSMRQNFSAALSEKAVEKLEEKKIEIAQNYFGQMSEEAEQVDEVLDTSDKRLKYGMKAAGSYIASSLKGDVNTKKKRLAGNKLYTKKVDDAGKKLVSKAKSVSGKKD